MLAGNNKNLFMVASISALVQEGTSIVVRDWPVWRDPEQLL